MITNAPLSSEIENAISGEKVDFVLKSSQLRTTGETAYFLTLSLIWLTITLITGGTFFIPLILYGSVNITINDIPTIVTKENLEVMIFPAVFIGTFIIIGVSIVSYALYGFFAGGGWYIGMPEGISHYRKGKTEFRKWDEFRSDVKVSGNDDQKGNITLSLSGQRPFFIAGIPNAKEVAEICKQRIQEKGLLTQ